MRLIKGIYENGQLTLDEPMDVSHPMQVVVVFDDDQIKPMPKPFVLSARVRGIDPSDTFRREDMYEDDMR